MREARADGIHRQPEPGDCERTHHHRDQETGQPGRKLTQRDYDGERAHADGHRGAVDRRDRISIGLPLGEEVRRHLVDRQAKEILHLA